MKRWRMHERKLGKLKSHRRAMPKLLALWSYFVGIVTCQVYNRTFGEMEEAEHEAYQHFNGPEGSNGRGVFGSAANPVPADSDWGAKVAGSERCRWRMKDPGEKEKTE
jgi:hypothetical protein